MSTVTAEQLGLPAQPWVVRRDGAPRAHLRAKLDRQLRTLLAHEPGTRAGSDPEELHQMRVAVRRMRSVLKDSRGLLGSGSDEVRNRLRWLADALGDVRDLDVLIEHLRDTVTEIGDRDQPAAERLISMLVAERREAKRRLNRKLETAKYRELLEELAALTCGPEDVPDHTEHTRKPLRETVRKRAGKFRTTLRTLPEDPTDEQLHDLRIRCKRLRYAAELAAPATTGKKTRKKIKSVVRAAKHLQDVLGEHQDAIVAAQRMRDTAEQTSDVAVGFVAGRIAERENARRGASRQRLPEAAQRVNTAARDVL